MKKIKVVNTISEIRRLVAEFAGDGKTVGFVPTMGYFHEGHLDLMRRSVKECGETVVSIFVNPMQFGPSEDLDRYPRDLARDCALAEASGAGYIFHPSVSEMYPAGFQTGVKAGPLASGFCGAFRPGHFDGVCTVVAKLFNIITPRRAYFGMKDYQQLVIIEKMTRDLDMDIEIIRCPTVRESDGLAMSSRNAYLDEAGRKNAVWLSRVIRSAAGAIIEKSGFDGGLELSRIESDCVARLIEKGFSSVDYFKIADAQTLKEFTDPASFYASDKIFIASAAYMGKTRLIDNIVFDKPRSASNVK